MPRKKIPHYTRPYLTYYYSGIEGDETATAGKGCSSTEEGALKAAIVRLFLGQYFSAVIYDRRTGVAVQHITKVKQGRRYGMTIGFGSGMKFREWRGIRR